MANITLLPSAKVPLIYDGDLTMTTEWYRFFWNIYGFTGTGVIPVDKGGTGLNTIGDHQLIIGNANNVFEPALLSSSSIAITYPPGYVNLELGPSGVTPGTYGSASQVGVFTVNQYGVLTSASSTSIAINANQIVSGTLVVARGGTGQSTYTDGQLLIGNSTGNTLSKATLTASTGISIINGAGSIAIANTGVLSVSGTAPVVSSGGATPAISMPQATALVSGYLSSTDWSTFNSKAPATTGTSILYGNGSGGFSNVTIGSGISFAGGTLSATGSGGTVTSVSGTGTVNGITLTGTVTSSGFLTLGGTLSGIANSQLTNSTISGVALGGTLFSLTAGTGVSFSSGTTYNGSAAITINATGSGGTVTSVAALTLGTTGTDLSSTVANSTTTPVITLNVPTASATNRGALSSTDWSTFNNKQDALISGTNIKTVGGVSLLGAGDVGVIGATYGGTGLSSYAVGDLLYADTTTTLAKLADVATGNALISGGVSAAPSWGKIGLTTHISGVLPTANGGTNLSSFTANGVFYATSTSIIGQSANLTFDGTTLSTTAISNSGNLTFNSTAQRIIGDMSNATVLNRLFFQNSVLNTSSSMGVIPNGTSTSASFDSFNNSDPTNASRFRFIATSTENQIQATITGTGTYLPLTIYTGGTQRINVNTSGGVGIGGTAAAGQNLLLASNITGATASQFVRCSATIQSDVTTEARAFISLLGTQAATFTCGTINHFYAGQGTFGLNSTVTNQAGFYAATTLTGATNNYGFLSAIASGANRYNFYASGTAANYFAGDMQFNKTVTSAGTTGAQTINKNAGTVNFAAAATSLAVTNNLVTTSSIIVCTVGTNDSTMKSVSAVAAAGSFTIYANAAATAETRVNFIVIN